jgi:hypothetical protein
MSVSRRKSDFRRIFDPAASWFGDMGPTTVSDAIPFSAGGGFGNTLIATGVGRSVRARR